jgi:hypothetical protein
MSIAQRSAKSDVTEVTEKPEEARARFHFTLRIPAGMTQEEARRRSAEALARFVAERGAR